MARSMRAATSSPQRAEARHGQVTSEDVARVAYELFQQRGGLHGHDLEDWLEAERIVQQRLHRSTSR